MNITRNTIDNSPVTRRSAGVTTGLTAAAIATALTLSACGGSSDAASTTPAGGSTGSSSASAAVTGVQTDAAARALLPQSVKDSNQILLGVTQVTGTSGLPHAGVQDGKEVGLDLVEVSPNADPPVAKFLDVGKYKYEAQKKANLARKSQKTQEIKEIKMRPNIDDHDYDTKMKKVAEFIGEGDKVKVTMRFRGRELSHGQLGMNVLQRVAEQVAEVAKVEAYPRMEGRQMLMVLAPK